MADSFEAMRSRLLALNEAERAELAHELIVSLTVPSDEDTGPAWEKEIDRRIAHIDSGQARLLDRDEFAKRMRSRTANYMRFIEVPDDAAEEATDAKAFGI